MHHETPYNKESAGSKPLVSAGIFFQPKLTVNQPNDAFEQEADAMADKVMRMADPSVNQSAFFKPAGHAVQRKCQACDELEKHVHRKENNAGEVQGRSGLDSYVSSLGSSGRSLPESSRQFFEPRFGQDFSNVRIHIDSVAAKSAQSINALAYTTGNNIVFNSGQYSPDSDSGKRLMAHELTHVVQQSNNLQAKVIQRLPGSPAGGCGLCYGTTKEVGLAAHIEIEKAFLARYPWLQTEFPVLGSPTDDNGKLDLADLDGRTHMSIGEVKPANAEGLAAGETDLVWYEKQLQGLGMSTGRLNLPPPLMGIPFPTLAPPGCPQTQLLFIDAPVRGTYTYWCTPDFKDLVKDCDCKKGKRKKPVPKFVPVPVPKPAPKEEKKKLDQPVNPPVPVPEPVPVPVPEPVPVKPPVGQPVPVPASSEVPAWVYALGGVAGAALIAACILSGACEVAAVVAAFGAAAEEVMVFLTASGVALRYAN